MPARSIWNLDDYDAEQLQNHLTEFSFGIIGFHFPPEMQLRLTGRFFLNIRELYNYVNMVENDDDIVFEDIFTFMIWLSIRGESENAFMDPPRLHRQNAEIPSFFSTDENMPFTPPQRVSYMTAREYLRIQELNAYDSDASTDLDEFYDE